MKIISFIEVAGRVFSTGLFSGGLVFFVLFCFVFIFGVFFRVNFEATSYVLRREHRTDTRMCWVSFL